MKTTQKYQNGLVILFLCLCLSCKESFLDIKPKGLYDEYSLATAEGVDGILIGAYSMLDGVSAQGFGWEAASSNWLFASVRGMEANGGSDSGDSYLIPVICNFSESPDHPYLLTRWNSIYEAISRCNMVIRVANNTLELGNISEEEFDLFVRQARVLRGWYHFEAWRMWKGMVPCINEKVDPTKAPNTPDIRNEIIADLTEGTKLPLDMEQVGRFNRTVSQVLLAKAMMQMDNDYEDALSLLNEARNGTKADGSPIGLAPTYGEIFEIENRNGIEAIYTVQYSVNDGSEGWNGGWGEALNFPYSNNGPAGCCGFFQPSQEFVNSFRTFEGLPLLDHSYNIHPVINDQGLAPDDSTFVEDTGPLDPRLDWTVGRRGIPYWDWGEHTGRDWIRDQTFGGPYSPKKQVYKKSEEDVYTEAGNWTSGFTANGYRMIRFADLLLLTAECQIETGDLVGALSNINSLRRRAANPEGFVKESDGTTVAANYQIAEYPSFPDAKFARKALKMERKLELGMEGHRYFDLNRWEITVEELNRVLEYESTMPWGFRYYQAKVGPEDVSYPIPQRVIDMSSGLIIQNR